MAKDIVPNSIGSSDNNKSYSNVKTFTDKYWEYGGLWSKEVKKNSSSFPTPEEMLLGLYKWLCE